MQEQADDLVASLIGLRSQDWVGSVKGETNTIEQPIGQTCDHTEEFYVMRRMLKERRRKLSQSVVRRDRKMSLDIATQCCRLREGFGKSISSSGWRNSLKDVLITGKQEWTRASNYIYEKLSTSCGSCRSEFTLTLSKHFCTVCGLAVCGACSSRGMILYVPDGEPSNQENVSWAIIKVVGCPEKEPSTCQYLRVCKDCDGRLRTHQMELVQNASVAGGDGDDFWSELIALERKITHVGTKIKTQLPQYRDIATMLGEGPDGGRMSSLGSGSHVQTLAKLQCDLSDHFSQSVMSVFELKRLKASTPTQASLLKNILKAKADMYFDATFAFRFFKNSLESAISLQGLSKIQRVVDENAMNNVYVIVRQLGLESLGHCTRHRLSLDLPTIIAQLEEVSQMDVKSYVADWDEHLADVTAFVQLNIKERPLLALSRRRLSHYSPIQIEVKVWWICFVLLRKAQLQLLSKTAETRFQRTKKCFEETLAAIHERIRTLG